MAAENDLTKCTATSGLKVSSDRKGCECWRQKAIEIGKWAHVLRPKLGQGGAD